MRHSTNNALTIPNQPDQQWTEEHPPCAVCGANAYVPLVVRNGHQVVRCRQCQLVYVSPRPRSRGPVDALYTDESYSARQVSHAATVSRMREAAWRLDHLERHVERRGDLLDVGCSAGSFLIAARGRGWAVRGIDVSPAAVDYAHATHGLDVSVATLEESRFATRSFDVVTIFECIEHMLDPRAALTAAADLLRDGGLLVITTPNVDGFVPRVTYWMLGRTLGAWEHPTPPHHLYQFSRRTLGALLHDAGFEITACETRPMGLRYTVKQLEDAIVEALLRWYRSPVTLATGEAGVGGYAGSRRDARPHARRLARKAIAGVCWILSLLLYAVPVRALGAGDAMLVVARKGKKQKRDLAMPRPRRRS
jgi:2-polyprenyl-3-methyl-5-hydroxy-6-metoxy-1,4-benzoquinol methylase